MVQVIILKANSSQSLLISFVYSATPSSKESFQLFKVGVAMFFFFFFWREGSVISIGIVVWYAFGRIFAIIGLRTSSGLKSRRLIKRVILRNGRKNL